MDKKNQVMGENQAVGERKRKWERGKKKISRCSDDRSSIVQELKLVHTKRAMRGYQNLNFSSKLQEVGVFSYTGFLFT